MKRKAALLELADAYFDGLSERPPTLSGLARALGLSRAELVCGRYRGPQRAAVLDAYQRYEAFLEERLHDKDGFRAAELCLLCNCGWAKRPDDEGDGLEARVLSSIKEAFGAID